MLKKSALHISAILVFFFIVSLLLYFSFNYGKKEILSLAAAGLLVSFNFIITLYIIDKNLTTRKNSFVNSFLIMTLIRFVFLLIIFFTIVSLDTINHFVFSAAFFILYFLFQMVEVYNLHTFKESGNVYK